MRTYFPKQGDIEPRWFVIDADGNDSNIDGAVKDQLRNYGITPVSSLQTSS